MSVAVDEIKYQQLCSDIRDFLAGEVHDRNGRIISYCGKSLERIRGKLISNLIVEPNLIIYTAEQDKAVEWMYRNHTYALPRHQFQNFSVTRELHRWLSLEGVQKKRFLYEHHHHALKMPKLVVWTDASGYAGGSVYTIEDEEGNQTTYSSTYCWDEETSDMPINFKVIFDFQF